MLSRLQLVNFLHLEFYTIIVDQNQSDNRHRNYKISSASVHICISWISQKYLNGQLSTVVKGLDMPTRETILKTLACYNFQL